MQLPCLAFASRDSLDGWRVDIPMRPSCDTQAILRPSQVVNGGQHGQLGFFWSADILVHSCVDPPGGADGCRMRVAWVSYEGRMGVA